MKLAITRPTTSSTRCEDLRRLAEALGRPADYASQVEVCRRLATLAAEDGDRRLEADSLLMLANALTQLAEVEEAEAVYARAQTAFEELGAETEVANCRQGRVNALQLLGRPRDALAEAEIVATSPDDFRRCTGLIGMGGLKEQLGDYDGSLSELARAEAVAHQLPGDSGHAAFVGAYIHGNRHNVFFARGELDSALNEARSMGASAEAANLRSQKLESMINVGVCLTQRGEMAEAWQTLNQALHLASLSGDRLREAVSQSAMAEWLTLAGLPERGIEAATAAGAIAREIKARFVEAYSLANLGAAMEGAGRCEQALEHAEAAARMLDDLSAPPYAAKARIVGAMAHLRLDRPDEAQSLLHQAHRLGAGLSAKPLTLSAQLALARVHLYRGRHEDGSETGFQALSGAEAMGCPHGLWKAYHVIADLAAAAGDRPRAHRNYRSAVNTVETMWWPLWAVGFAQTRRVAGPIVDLYMATLSNARAQGQDAEIERILALAPWASMRDLWEERQGGRA
jgi:tetratricopeptide (TPR) repeat protein